jgi:hypothetical protein
MPWPSSSMISSATPPSSFSTVRTRTFSAYASREFQISSATPPTVWRLDGTFDASTSVLTATIKV